MRGIQNDHEKDEREKQRAKAEVERLNRAVGRAPTASTQSNTQSSRNTLPTNTSQTTSTDRRRQLAQLAEMGVSIANDYRGEMPLAGGWQVVSQKIIDPEEQAPNDNSLNIGVRKRKFEGQEEEEEAGETVVRKGWGSTTKEYPSNAKQSLEALLSSSIAVKTEGDVLVTSKEETDRPAVEDHNCYDANEKTDTLVAGDNIRLKQEDVSEPLILPDQAPDSSRDTPNNTTEAPEIVFKKRKSKNSRQK